MTRRQWLGLVLCGVLGGLVVATGAWLADPSYPWWQYAIAVPIAVVVCAVVGVLLVLATVARWW